MRGIFAVDGGNATGLAWGIFDETADSVKAAIDSRLDAGSHTVNRYTTSKRKGEATVRKYPDGMFTDYEQIVEIANRLSRFRTLCMLKNAICELVIEDFTLFPGQHAGGKDGVASVRIAWGLTGYLMGRRAQLPPIWQQPGVMGKVKDEHLKKYGIWVPGRDHERAAWRHICARLDKLLR